MAGAYDCRQGKRYIERKGKVKKDSGSERAEANGRFVSVFYEDDIKGYIKDYTYLIEERLEWKFIYG